MITIDELQLLKDTNIEKYREVIIEPWDTEQQDLELINKLIDAAEARDEDGKINFTTSFHPSEDGVEVKFPGWLVTAVDEFSTLYGMDMGQVILEKCLHKLWENVVPAQPLSMSE